MTMSKTNDSISKPKSNKDKRITKLQFKTLRLWSTLRPMFHQTDCGKTYDPLVNPNDKTTIIHDESDDEAEEPEIEEEPFSSKPTKSDPPPLKAYKLKIPYPQCLRKEKMEERYVKFIDLIKEVRIKVPDS
ncbi:hypothetical protein Tco_1369292 [Tanacetum coccineum]